MKLLFLSQAKTIADQSDFDASFKKAKSRGEQLEVLNIPYLGYAKQYGWNALYREVLRQNAEFKPDVVYFQFYHSGGDEGIADCCRELKKSTVNKPLIFGSIGDLFYTGWRKCLARPLPKSALDLAANSDAFFSTSMGNIADEFVKHGVRNMIFLPNAFGPVHFPYWGDSYGEGPSYDITMLCSKGHLFGRKVVACVQNNWRRRYVVGLLSKTYGRRFSIFGRNWNGSSAVGCVPFLEQVRYYMRSRVVVDAPAPIMGTDYYSSDRAFYMLGSGSPLVYFNTPRFEKIMRPEEHAFYAYSLREVIPACERALSLSDDERANRRIQVQKFVRERHLIDHRVDTIVSTAEALMGCRQGKLSAADALRTVRMHHFLPEVDMEEEYKFCTRNWQG